MPPGMRRSHPAEYSGQTPARQTICAAQGVSERRSDRPHAPRREAPRRSAPPPAALRSPLPFRFRPSPAPAASSTAEAASSPAACSRPRGHPAAAPVPPGCRRQTARRARPRRRHAFSARRRAIGRHPAERSSCRSPEAQAQARGSAPHPRRSDAPEPVRSPRAASVQSGYRRRSRRSCEGVVPLPRRETRRSRRDDRPAAADSLAPFASQTRSENSRTARRAVPPSPRCPKPAGAPRSICRKPTLWAGSAGSGSREARLPLRRQAP